MSLKMNHSKTEIKGVIIKGCPFCGNQNLQITDKQWFDELCEEHGKALMQIECRVCDTTKTMYSVPDNNYWIGVGLLVARWNMRCGHEDNSRD